LRHRVVPLAAGALVAATCGALAFGAAPGSSSAPTPVPSPPVSGPRAVMPSGAVYRLELATIPEDQAQGLMYRENLPDRTGMLFVFAGEPNRHHFWMKNTMIPLDIVWLNETGQVIFVSAETPPCKADPCPTYGPDVPVRRVLELAGGLAAKEGVVVGSVIELRDLPD
jgi:uncharacterized membrane protein (UPF0127 family)